MSIEERDPIYGIVTREDPATQEIQVLVEEIPTGEYRPYFETKPHNGKPNFTAMDDYLKEKNIPWDSAQPVELPEEGLKINGRKAGAIYDFRHETRTELIPENSRYSWYSWKAATGEANNGDKKVRLVPGAEKIIVVVDKHLQPK